MDEQLRRLPKLQALHPVPVLRDLHVLLHCRLHVQAGLGHENAAHLTGADIHSVAFQPQAHHDNAVLELDRERRGQAVQRSRV